GRRRGAPPVGGERATRRGTARIAGGVSGDARVSQRRCNGEEEAEGRASEDCWREAEKREGRQEAAQTGVEERRSETEVSGGHRSPPQLVPVSLLDPLRMGPWRNPTTRTSQRSSRRARDSAPVIAVSLPETSSVGV